MDYVKHKGLIKCNLSLPEEEGQKTSKKSSINVIILLSASISTREPCCLVNRIRLVTLERERKGVSFY
jgi:hypothetical protein